MIDKKENNELLTFGGHVNIMRKMIFRILIVVVCFSIVFFCFKDETFDILLAPHKSDFITFSFIENIIALCGFDFHFVEYDIQLISTELPAQFLTHITVSCIMACLISSPYVIYELFRFVTPALYVREKRYSYVVAAVIFILFLTGLFMSYFVIFPISFQFLATYQVDEDILNTITLSSYISTFSNLTFLLGIVFQLPVLSFIFGKMGLINANLLKRYRAFALVMIMVIAAIITPPDVFTLIFVTIPLYGLYEISIIVFKVIVKNNDV